MAQRSKASFKTTKNSRYADNTSGLVTATNSRDMFEDAADSFISLPAATTLTANRIPFADSNTVIKDDAALTWDNTNKFLLIGDGTNGKLHFNVATEFDIQANTADGFDTKVLSLAGGGLDNVTRGAHIKIAGNENVSQGNGVLELFAGDTTGAYIGFRTGFAVERMRINSTGNVGIGTSTPNAPLQFANVAVNRKIVLFEDFNNDHQYYGFGVNSGILRYQVSGTTDSHVFYAGTSSTTSNELGRLTGTGLLSVKGTGTFNTTYQLALGSGNLKLGESASGGEIQSFSSLPLYINPLGNNVILNSGGGNVGIGTTSPNAPLQFANVVANRKLVLFENTNNNHQYLGFGINSSVLRYQVGSTTEDHVFFAGTSSIASNELFRIKGNGSIVINLPIQNDAETKLLVRNSTTGDIEYREATTVAAGAGTQVITATVQTTNATPTTIYTFAMPASASARFFEIDVLGKQSGANEAVVFRRMAVGHTNGAATTVISHLPTTLQSAGLNTTNMSASGSSNNCVITVTGVAATTIDWYLTLTVRAPF